MQTIASAPTSVHREKATICPLRMVVSTQGGDAGGHGQAVPPGGASRWLEKVHRDRFQPLATCEAKLRSLGFRVRVSREHSLTCLRRPNKIGLTLPECSVNVLLGEVETKPRGLCHRDLVSSWLTSPGRVSHAVMAQQATPDSRQRFQSLAAVAVAVAVLLGLVFGIGIIKRGPIVPLDPDGRLDSFRHVSLETKQATVRLLLNDYKADGLLSSRVAAELDDPIRAARLVDEVVAGLDRANDRNTHDYVPPAETLRSTGRDLVIKNGWDK